MSYYILVDSSSNQINGLYSDLPGYPLIPADAIKISDADAKTLTAGFSNYKFVNGSIIESPLGPTPGNYNRDRAAAYPPITDYLDGIVKGDAAQVKAYIDACLAVKAKFPKPTGA